jgi:hypothetical protein
VQGSFSLEQSDWCRLVGARQNCATKPGTPRVGVLLLEHHRGKTVCAVSQGPGLIGGGPGRRKPTVPVVWNQLVHAALLESAATHHPSVCRAH